MSTPRLREMTEADITALITLGRRIWNLHYPGIITQQQIDHIVPIIYNTTRIRDELARGVRYLLAEIEKDIVGYIAWEAIADTPSAYFIHKLYVDPTRHRMGIASSLLSAALQRIPHATHVELLTHRQNVKGLAFYEKQGFEIIAAPETPIGDYFFPDYRLRKMLHYGTRAAV